MDEFSEFSLIETVIETVEDAIATEADNGGEILANLLQNILAKVADSQQRLLLESMIQAGIRKACLLMFGASGKATIKAFLASDRNRWQWAQALGEKNPDACQQILKLDRCIEFEKEAIGFLLSLSRSTRIRMLRTTCYSLHGEQVKVDRDLVYTVANIWEKLDIKPNLGRVRCWFSLKIKCMVALAAEHTAKATTIPIPQEWRKINGFRSESGWELVIPQSYLELDLYGKALDNCIRWYFYNLLRGLSIVVVVNERPSKPPFWSLEPTHCLEVRFVHLPGSALPKLCGAIAEFKGVKNSEPNHIIEREVTDFLKQKGLVIC